MRRNHFINNILFFILIYLVGGTPVLAEAISAPTVELPSTIHFLTPAGEDVEVGPGIYEVEAADAWLKLVPQGESPSTAVLLEAILGPHEEDVTEPLVRTISQPENPDVLYLGLLMPDGVGLEAAGTVTGIRPRAFNFAFVGRTSKAKTLVPTPGMNAPRPGSQTQAPTPRPTGQPVDCGPYQKVIGKATRHSPALAVFGNELHLVTSDRDRPPNGIEKFTLSAVKEWRATSTLDLFPRTMEWCAGYYRTIQ